MEVINEIHKWLKRMKKIASAQEETLRYKVEFRDDGTYSILLDIKERGAAMSDASMES